ncbi:Wzz/FepE/Etk N-terminal domain-containing protein [Kocuria carniphila]|uniref:Wzz/FepE/Etk N-terminal domain-containing protein n=1 Tax=Kocuria carniphila TaxID=262208 RepID=UPI00101DBA9D|nr:Wzz/FepE/Etk N-terminal domain-containing protein [Kocuria carniphila]
MGSSTKSQFTRRRKRTGSHETAPLEISQLVTRVLRRWPTVLFTALLVLGLVVLASLLAPRSYTATASVSVSPIVTASNLGGATANDVDMPTEIATATSRVVAERAAQDLGAGDDQDLVSELLENTEIGSPSQSSVMRINVTANSAETAADRANALADAYLTDRQDTAETRAKDAADSLQDSLGDMSSDDPSRQSLEETLIELRSASPWPGRIISSALPPATSTGPGLSAAVLAGALGGLMLGLVAALIRDRIAPRVGYADRLEDRVGMAAVDANGEPVHVAVSDAVSALDDRFGLASKGRLAVTSLNGETPESAVEEFEHQLTTWSVAATPMAQSRSDVRQTLQSFDAVAVLVDPRDDLDDTAQLLASLDRGTASILPVVWNHTGEGRL